MTFNQANKVRFSDLVDVPSLVECRTCHHGPIGSTLCPVPSDEPVRCSDWWPLLE